ncbi:hypothetical protein [Gordonia tangerina]|uniref:Uncharacterized protein n=1 Tax=Gordonia tangerina TaxID=2911060 RepID=A0ABS9DL43_9ACTN|nr:hypothetical protein [Gordonia tangerina]MCF3939955.1 hypothetical protein [Gordonia tangerina]
MSHFSFYTEPAPVGTRHGDIYIGLGESTTGDESVSIVCHDQDRYDIHLSREQAIVLRDLLSEHIDVMSRRREVAA